jgi:hypothetical protein
MYPRGCYRNSSTRVAEAEAARTSPGSRALVEVFKLAGPSVILLDELTMFARQLDDDRFEAFLSFIQSLTEAAKPTFRPGRARHRLQPAQFSDRGGDGVTGYVTSSQGVATPLRYGVTGHLAGNQPVQPPKEQGISLGRRRLEDSDSEDGARHSDCRLVTGKRCRGGRRARQGGAQASRKSVRPRAVALVARLGRRNLRDHPPPFVLGARRRRRESARGNRQSVPRSLSQESVRVSAGGQGEAVRGGFCDFPTRSIPICLTGFRRIGPASINSNGLAACCVSWRT